MSQVETQTRAERLAAEIADAIMTGDLPPGSRLDEQGLAERYSVSRTPVREALRQLGSTGLIETRPRRGAIVVQPTARQMEDMFVAMGELEASCARLAALSMTPIDRRRLAGLQAEMGELVAADDEAGYADANTAFHGAIYAGTRNLVLEEIATGLRRRLSPYRRAQFRSPGRLPRSHAEHALVVQAIVAGDAMAAHAAMMDHVTSVEHAVERWTARRAAGRVPGADSRSR